MCKLVGASCRLCLSTLPLPYLSVRPSKINNVYVFVCVCARVRVCVCVHVSQDGKNFLNQRSSVLFLLANAGRSKKERLINVNVIEINARRDSTDLGNGFEH